MANIAYGPIEFIEPSTEHTASVIICHGMGDSGMAWKKHVTAWDWHSRLPHVRFIFPTAPVRDLTLVPSRMTAWFDVLCTKDVAGEAHDEAGMQQSQRYIQLILEREIASGITPSRIVLGGFSQGGAIALLTGLSLPFTLRGVFSLCGYLPMIPRILEIDRKGLLLAPDDRSSRQMFLANGTNDPKVKYPWAEWSAGALKLMGFNVDFRSYLRLGHCMHPRMVKEILDWVDLQIPLDKDWADVLFS